MVYEPLGLSVDEHDVGSIPSDGRLERELAVPRHVHVPADVRHRPRLPRRALQHLLTADQYNDTEHALSRSRTVLVDSTFAS